MIVLTGLYAWSAWSVRCSENVSGVGKYIGKHFAKQQSYCHDAGAIQRNQQGEGISYRSWDIHTFFVKTLDGFVVSQHQTGRVSNEWTV